MRDHAAVRGEIAPVGLRYDQRDRVDPAVVPAVGQIRAVLLPLVCRWRLGRRLQAEHRRAAHKHAPIDRLPGDRRRIHDPDGRAGLERVETAVLHDEPQPKRPRPGRQRRAAGPGHHLVDAVALQRLARVLTVSRDDRSGLVQHLGLEPSPGRPVVYVQPAFQPEQLLGQHRAGRRPCIQRGKAILAQGRETDLRVPVALLGMGVVEAAVVQPQRVALDQRVGRGEHHPVVPRPGRPQLQNRRSIAILTRPVDAVAARGDLHVDLPLDVPIVDASKNPQEAQVHRLVRKNAEAIEVRAIHGPRRHPAVIDIVGGQDQLRRGPGVEVGGLAEGHRPAAQPFDVGRRLVVPDVPLLVRVPGGMRDIAAGDQRVARHVIPVDAVGRPAAIIAALFIAQVRVTPLGFRVERRVHHRDRPAAGGIDVVGGGTVVRKKAQRRLVPVEPVGAGRVAAPAHSLGVVQEVVPHAVARAVLGRQDRAVEVHVRPLPRLIGLDHRIARMLLKRMIRPGDVRLGLDQEVIDQQLPRPGQVAERLARHRPRGHQPQDQQTRTSGKNKRPVALRHGASSLSVAGMAR